MAGDPIALHHMALYYAALLPACIQSSYTGAVVFSFTKVVYPVIATQCQAVFHYSQ